MTSWYFKDLGETIGPLTSLEIRKCAQNGQIKSDTLVTRDGTDRWVTADRVAGLFDSAPSPVIPQALQNTPSRTVQSPSSNDDNNAIKEHHPMPVTATNIKEYKVLTQKDKWFSGKFDPAKLEEALNAYAEQGWVVKAATTAAITGFIGANREELIIILER